LYRISRTNFAKLVAPFMYRSPPYFLSADSASASVPVRMISISSDSVIIRH